MSRAQCAGSFFNPEPSEYSDSLISEGEGKGVWMHEGSCVEQVPSAKPYQEPSEYSDSLKS